MKILPFLILLFLICPTKNHAATFTVINTNDNGAGSLRDAISQANANGIADNIIFNIPGGGPHSINLVTELPEITDDNTLIDGSTQGSLVTLNGITSTFNGMLVSGNFCTIKELHFTNFTDGIRLLNTQNGTIQDCFVNSVSECGIFCLNGPNAIISGNRVGTNLTGTADLSGMASDGILVIQSDNLLIQNNIISGFEQVDNAGITLFKSNNNTIQNNWIGTDIGGSTPIPNYIGISILNESNGNQIKNNIISGNLHAGIKFEVVATGPS